MFADEISSGSRRIKVWIALSWCVHILVVFVVVRTWPEFVLSSSLATSDRGSATYPVPSQYVLIYGGGLRPPITKPPAQARLRFPRKQRARAVPAHNALAEAASAGDAAGDDLHLGPVLRSSRALWFPSIHDIKVALPQVTPQPDIRLADIPNGYEGDVVVEITIDKEGKVVRAKVEQTFGGLDKKVVAALLNWRFKPASYDGVPVASLQEIHFHYPDNALR